MAGGIDISIGSIASLAGIGAISVISGDLSPLAALIPTIGPYRPAQWARSPMTMITVPPAYAKVATNNPLSSASAAEQASSGVFTIAGTGSKGPGEQAPQIYVFDAVLRTGHSQHVTITQHPVQSGSNVNDHAFLHPARLTMVIGMSDAMAAYAPGMWRGNSSKSVSAFHMMDDLRASRIPLTITTRLKSYTNMLIEEIRVDDSIKTIHGLSAIIEFQQIFVANVSQQTISSRPQTTDSTNQGTSQPAQPVSGTISQNQLPSPYTNVPDPSTIEANAGTVQGAGNWSSNNTADIASLYT